MKIMMIPGERNEELIAKVSEAVAVYREEGSNIIYDLIDEYGVDEVFDALYYACENGEEMLQDQTNYFTGLLHYDEVPYYISRMTGVDY